MYSAALCRGLIEARVMRSHAASNHLYSAALCRGLIEASSASASASAVFTAYSAALCRGLIEARIAAPRHRERRASIPRLYAAASLKRPAGSDR